MDDAFHSLNRGVFVIPFNPDAGPSTPVPGALDKTYAAARQVYEAAYEEHENARTEEQLAEIEDWLSNAAAPPVFTTAFVTKRLPVALVQSLSTAIVPSLGTLPALCTALNGRDMPDLAAATRAVAVGFLGDAALAAKKAGRTPIDEVERWWQAEEREPLLVLIQNAQLVPSTVLSELIYILNLHDVPFRLLISVPSIMVFTASWTLLEPGDVALDILSAGRGRRRGAGVSAILNVAVDPQAAPISISDAVRDELQREDDMFGGGPADTLKSLRWLLLHHAHNSPLAAIAEGDVSEERAKMLRSIVDGIREGREGDGQELFMIDSVPDLLSTQNPAARLSILQALAKPASFLDPDAEKRAAGAADEEDDDDTPRRDPRTGTALGKRKAPDSPTALLNGHAHTNGRADDPASLSQRFQEIEALHALWRSAGKSVNLWDWLEGFRAAMTKDEAKESGEGSEGHGETNGHSNGNGNGHGGGDAMMLAPEDKDAEEQAQHATFIRFIEESRMFGLVRARGSRTARRADEVVKGVLMI